MLNARSLSCSVSLSGLVLLFILHSLSISSPVKEVRWCITVGINSLYRVWTECVHFLRISDCSRCKRNGLWVKRPLLPTWRTATAKNTFTRVHLPQCSPLSKPHFSLLVLFWGKGRSRGPLFQLGAELISVFTTFSQIFYFYFFLKTNHTSRKDSSVVSWDPGS